jgi:hypothetical protein
MSETRDEESTPPPPRAPKPEKEIEFHPKAGVRHREWNRVEGWIGMPESGKTQSMIKTALEWQKKYKCYVVAHDLGWKIPTQLHDGTPTGVVYHRNIDEARASIYKQGGGIHSISSPSGHEPLALARELGQTSLQRSKTKGWGFPVLFIVDEIVVSRLADRKIVDDEMRLLISDRRHAHVACLWGVQHVRFVNAALIALSTKVHVTRVTDNFSHKHLVECGLQEDFVSRLPQLGDFEFATAKIG